MLGHRNQVLNPELGTYEPAIGYEDDHTCQNCHEDEGDCTCDEPEDDLPEFVPEPAPQVRRLVGLMVLGAIGHLR